MLFLFQNAVTSSADLSEVCNWHCRDGRVNTYRHDDRQRRENPDREFPGQHVDRPLCELNSKKKLKRRYDFDFVETAARHQSSSYLSFGKLSGEWGD
jgi:hypothetical protein